MPWTLASAPTQHGRVAIVTGANIGLGFDTAQALVATGCTVVLACRNADKAKTAANAIRATHPQAEVQCMTLDLASLRSVRQFAARFCKKFERLDLLINNAGLMMPPHTLTEDGFESQWGTNYLGHFALTGWLLPLLDATPGARVVSLASIAHRFGPIRFDDPNFNRRYDRRLAYGQSKLACLTFAFELDRRLRTVGSGTLSVAAHPGVAATNLAQYFPKFLTMFFPLVGQSAARGALPTLYAALGVDIKGGDYCGPDGPFEWRGNPVKVGSSRAARDPTNGQRLWEISEQATEVRFLSGS